MFLATRNLVSTETKPCVPWEFSRSAPDEVKGKEGKKARDAWINDPSTDWQCYTAFEGLHPGLRISEDKGEQEGNPAFKLHSFVADYDTAVSLEELQKGCERCPYPPNYYERTLSGHARLLWFFEKPVAFPSTRFAVEFLKLALKKFKPDTVAPALDAPAWETPNRLYTNSGEWMQVDVASRIPHSLLLGWVVEAAERHRWKKDRHALEIPLPVVWPELQKKYPRSSEWQGDFTLEAQGPSFWIDGSASPKSAIVKSTGIFTFSAHAAKPFYSWADLLGKDWADRYQTELLGKAVEEIYHDGKGYWRKDGYGVWKPFSKEDIVLFLSTERGLSNTKENGLPSEIARALSYVHNWQGINGAAPFVYQESGILERHGHRYLNTHSGKVFQPAGQGSETWGPSGRFPFLSMFFDGFFHPKSKPANPLEHWLAWLRRFYGSAHIYALESGQNTIIMGPPGFGKSFLNQFLLPLLMGGSAEAQAFLLGQTQFNSQLFSKALWTVDDNSVTVDAHTIRVWTSMLKKMAANQFFEYNEKFRVATGVEWRGRVTVTANCDEISAMIIPDLSQSIMDKLSLYRCADVCPVKFPARRELVKLVTGELPHFARWLLDWEPPEYTQGDARFGTAPYHEASLVRIADQSSSTASFLETLEIWRDDYFSSNTGVQRWEGTSAQLMVALHANEVLARATLHGMSSRLLLQHLGALKTKGLSWIRTKEGSNKVWVIERPGLPGITPLPVGNGGAA